MQSSSPDHPTADRPRSIPLPSPPIKYAALLEGTTGTRCMRSGYVELLAGESVGLHSTGEHEELLVTLSGFGELLSPGMDPMPMHSGCVLYNPPRIAHDVVNRGDQPLRYIYIVA